MEKTRLLTLAVLGLLILNLGTLSYLFLHNGQKRNSPPHHIGPKTTDIIIHELQLNASQQDQYKQLVKEHTEAIRSVEIKKKELKESLFRQLKAENSVKRDSMIIAIGEVQKKIELIHYEHFENIKALCNEDQMSAFEELTERLARLFHHPPRHHRKPH